MKFARIPVLCLFSLGLAGCHGMGRSAGSSAGRSDEAPLLEGLGDHSRKIVTTSALAQKYFDQGLTLAYAFNHDEAIRSFKQAARLDPDAAMAWWGIALCNGPHINNPAMPESRSRAAWDALQKALALQEGATPADRALILALAQRYADPPPADRRHLDEAYAEAMREVQRRFTDDPDVGTLFAEALMDLRPWDLWTREGRPQPGTTEILAVLERVLARAPNHPGALHLYIHAVEASPHPERGIEAADRLRDRVPAAGHLVHMPSHIDVLTGRWALASDQNERAIEVDRRYRAISPRQDFYHVYMAHNHHMLAFAAMMEGRRAVALRAAADLIAGVPKEYVRKQAALVDPYLMIVNEVRMRFGMWDDILRERKPARYLPISTALWHFTRGVAYAAQGQLSQAEAERAALRRAVEAVPEDAMMAVNTARHVLSIAEQMLDGEIAYRRGDIDGAVAALRAAVRLEDDLRYMEPPEWIQPVRHTLGAILLDAGRVAEAEQVYREDLKEWPENGWSLLGLARCLERSGGSTEAKAAQDRLRRAWARADVPIHASCLCVAAPR